MTASEYFALSGMCLFGALAVAPLVNWGRLIILFWRWQWRHGYICFTLDAYEDSYQSAPRRGSRSR